MNKLNVVYVNHLDLTWRRPRYSAGISNGYTVIPYSELQEQQLDAGFDFAREGGCYTIEQTISLREYLQRNPDCKEEIKEMIESGHVTVLGGGESVVDYNLPDGESLIRNHVYSRRWLEKQFGFAPKLAACPDTFGLSAGLPTLFRELGYKGVTQFDRVFQQHKPLWRGISGDTVALDTVNALHNSIPLSAYTKARVCGICGGRGCPNCADSGFINVYADDGEADDLAATCREKGESGDVTLFVTGEECTAPDGMYEKLCRIAEYANLELRFAGPDELAMEQYGDLLETVDDPDAEKIDERTEGNPVATGCYTTRIRLKQENRRCESALRCAEHLAVAASLKGVPYPKETFERLWIDLAYLHFHDSLPASHSDDVYAELMEVARKICASAGRITRRSADILLKDVTVAEGEGIPFIVINPLEFDVKNTLLTGVVYADENVTGGTVLAPDGSRHEVLTLKHTIVPESEEAQIEFFGDLPAFGYGVFRFLPRTEEAAAPQRVTSKAVMENEHLRVELGKYNILSICDKKTGKIIACEGSFAPLLEDGPGHAWGRLAAVHYAERADKGDFQENMLPCQKLERSAKLLRCGDLQIAEIRIVYAREATKLDWTLQLILPDGSDRLQVRINAAFDARDIKLSTGVVLPETPKNGMLDYEIPLGYIARGTADAYTDQLGYADEWAALRYVRGETENSAVTLCNSGTPAHSLQGNTIAVSLLRTPTLQMCMGVLVDGTVDTAPHTFDFTLSANCDHMESYRRGMSVNTRFPAFHAEAKAGSLPQTGAFMAKLPADAPLLALKGAEDGNGYIARYLGREQPLTLKFDHPVQLSSILEGEAQAPDTEVKLPPFAIRTLRINEALLKN